MDQLKKNLFWIILGVLVVGGLGLYFSFAPNVEDSRNNFSSAADKLKDLADKSNRPGSIKNDNYGKAAAAYMKELEAQKAALLKKWEGQKIEVKFADAPDPKKPTIEFDNFVSKTRDALAAKMTAAGVKLPADWAKITFADSGVDDRSADLRRHRDYRLRYMAVLDEVVDALCSKPGSINAVTFETDPEKPETVQPQPVGPIELVKFVFNIPENDAKISAQEYAKVMALSGRKATPRSGADTTFKGPEVPLSISSVEVEFVSHISAVPPVIRKIESSSRYFGIVTKADFERSAPLFPPTKEVRAATDPMYKATVLPNFNTHFNEGPVRVLLAMDIYEYDKKKAELFEKPPAPAPKPPAPKK